MKTLLVIFAILFTTTIQAEEKYTNYVLKTNSGEVYRDYAVLSATENVVKISHVTGVAEIKIADLTAESLKAIQPKLDELKKQQATEKPKEEIKTPEKKKVVAEEKPVRRERPRLARAALAGTPEGTAAQNR